MFTNFVKIGQPRPMAGIGLLYKIKCETRDWPPLNVIAIA